MNALNIAEYMHSLGLQAREASARMAAAPAAVKAKALRELAGLLRSSVDTLQADNRKDLERATAAGLSAPMVDRLKLTPQIIETPSLSIKSGNACILRGGSEAIESNKALARLVQEALVRAGLPPEAVQLVQTTDREAVGRLIAMPEHVDVVIPRGGKGLIERISRDAKVPVIKHLDGNCHTYVDDPCDIAMAVKVADNAKTQKYSPCNASEGLLVARGVAREFLPRIGAVFAAKGVEMRCDPEARAILQSVPGADL